jgi:hypothetical protein
MAAACCCLDRFCVYNCQIDLADTRGLTARELAERELKTERKAVVQQQAQNAPVEGDSQTIVVQRRPISPPPPSPPLRLPIRTPERPRPRRAPSPEDSPEASRTPSSTAPLRLGDSGDDEGRNKRKRKPTARAEKADAGER